MISKPPDDGDIVDAEESDKYFIAKLEPCIIKSSDSDEIVWNNDAYSFIMEDCPPDVANSSLWRQSQLCYKQGLYRVTDLDDERPENIYQVRGFDLSNITIVEAEGGVIVIDPLVSMECAQAALKLYNDNINPEAPLEAAAIIFSHSHVDHFGGVEGVLPSGGANIDIYAPSGFMENAVSENVYAGNAMNRRATYMYGDRMPKDPEHQIGTGLGMTSSSGSSTVMPVINISSNGIQRIAGIDVDFQLTPGTEAPAEMNFYFPTFKALCMAENATHTMHNIQTLRGALVRDAHKWSKYLDEAIALFVEPRDISVVFASHHWPKWEKPAILEFMTSQRDMYAYLNDQTLRMLNNGRTGLEIAEVFRLPDTLSDKWWNQGYYGSISHNVKAVYHRYMGWFDGNPAHLWEWPPVEAGQFYIECMGGAGKVINLALGYKSRGNLRFAATLLSHAVFGTPPTDTSYDRAKTELALVLKQLGYGAESGPWRNFFLFGAYELENGIQDPVIRPPDPNSMMALSLDQLMDTMAVRLAGPETTPASRFFSIEFTVTDMTEAEGNRILLTLSNCALTNRYLIELGGATPTLVCSSTHSQLVQLVMKQIPITDITVVSGDSSVWDELMSYLTVPNPAFAIVTPE
ncbi:hypothetical protein GP486_003741 [Trichoglossum hirsutum]|uniref:Metallo-beta-lactamase domain-containing protein n=1 Tax=Trichoglossum hirsutum TaxID=265104 RepID=A0A9P8LCP2_9PEZI|nr:hypothetical protein GP486_003741 [Trichoglossum hirsutum]